MADPRQALRGVAVPVQSQAQDEEDPCMSPLGRKLTCIFCVFVVCVIFARPLEPVILVLCRPFAAVEEIAFKPIFLPFTLIGCIGLCCYGCYRDPQTAIIFTALVLLFGGYTIYEAAEMAYEPDSGGWSKADVLAAEPRSAETSTLFHSRLAGSPPRPAAAIALAGGSLCSLWLLAWSTGIIRSDSRARASAVQEPLLQPPDVDESHP
eukprot:CAMPEP_0170572220 /NCGR_PEP_ID=MMETSP0224-20130122/2093_1 /TAXON_ID=285029 /ORGANISM="Togula jolla, Strain CCCM 725" /LENGTH=207 /DNA_ID=CAMNT_0010894681 /DNA_START=14 /DNA_END=637 /DNA_ORIENTATION=+